MLKPLLQFLQLYIASEQLCFAFKGMIQACSDSTGRIIHVDKDTIFAEGNKPTGFIEMLLGQFRGLGRSNSP